jgi:hypothetical protein
MSIDNLDMMMQQSIRKANQHEHITTKRLCIAVVKNPERTPSYANKCVPPDVQNQLTKVNYSI